MTAIDHSIVDLTKSVLPIIGPLAGVALGALLNQRAQTRTAELAYTRSLLDRRNQRLRETYEKLLTGVTKIRQLATKVDLNNPTPLKSEEVIDILNQMNVIDTELIVHQSRLALDDPQAFEVKKLYDRFGVLALDYFNSTTDDDWQNDMERKLTLKEMEANLYQLDVELIDSVAKHLHQLEPIPLEKKRKKYLLFGPEVKTDRTPLDSPEHP